VRRQSITIGVGTLCAVMLVAGCSSSGGAKKSATAAAPSASTPATSSAPASSTTAAAPPATSTLFGPGCAALGLTPTTTAAAKAAPVGTVAASVPFLSNVVAAANTAGLTSTLNSAPALTVFAPIDAAFKKEPPAQVQALLTDPKQKPLLIKTLKYHVLAGKIDKAQLAGAHKTQEGSAVRVTGSGESYVVNGTAHILCGGLQTSNAVVYLIDRVLHPTS
jgi:uncharacterized surface protein with fasciclin (FAS1) repeats